LESPIFSLDSEQNYHHLTAKYTNISEDLKRNKKYLEHRNNTQMAQCEEGNPRKYKGYV
jgi:hypothetical protein